MRHSVESHNDIVRWYLAHGTDEEGPGRQIWRAPTELLKVCVKSDCLTSRLSILLILAIAVLWVGHRPMPGTVSGYLLKYFPY